MEINNMKRTWSDVYNENNVKLALLVGSLVGGAILTFLGLYLVIDSLKFSWARQNDMIGTKIGIAIFGVVQFGLSIFELYKLKQGPEKIKRSTYDMLFSVRVYKLMIMFYRPMSNKIDDEDEKDIFIKHGDKIDSILNWYLSLKLATPMQLKAPNTNRIVYAAAAANALAGPAVGIAAGISEASKVTKQQIAYEQNKKAILEHKITVDNYEQILTENYNAMLVIISHYKELTDGWNEVVQEEKKKMNKEYKISMF